MAASKALGGVGALLLAGPLLYSVTQSVAARTFHKEIPKGAKPYPSIYSVALQGQPTNTSLFGLAAAGAVGLGTAIATRRLIFTPMLQRLRKEHVFVPGTTNPKRITNLRGLLNDLSPDIAVGSLNLLIGVIPAAIAKALVDGPGRFKGWGAKPAAYEQAHVDHTPVTRGLEDLAPWNRPGAGQGGH